MYTEEEGYTKEKRKHADCSNGEVAYAAVKKTSWPNNSQLFF